jgi:polyferredoxin
MLRSIKLIHNIVWIVMVAADLYILYAGITKTFNLLLIISIVLLVIETLVLVFNGWTCPLTSVAGKYTEDRSANFDIYLPGILAKYNKAIFGTIFIAGITLVIINWVRL